MRHPKVITREKSYEIETRKKTINSFWRLDNGGVNNGDNSALLTTNFSDGKSEVVTERCNEIICCSSAHHRWSAPTDVGLGTRRCLKRRPIN